MLDIAGVTVTDKPRSVAAAVKLCAALKSVPRTPTPRRPSTWDRRRRQGEGRQFGDRRLLSRPADQDGDRLTPVIGLSVDQPTSRVQRVSSATTRKQPGGRTEGRHSP